MAWEYGPTVPGASEVKTGIKAGFVVIVEDIVLLKDGLSVRTQWVGRVIRRTKFDEKHSGGLANMVVFGRRSRS
jgi:hypothetical protein